LNDGLRLPHAYVVEGLRVEPEISRRIEVAVSHSAVSAVTPRFPRTISIKVAPTPSEFANWLTFYAKRFQVVLFDCLSRVRGRNHLVSLLRALRLMKKRIWPPTNTDDADNSFARSVFIDVDRDP
jgi:hypothetical protein